MPAICCSGRRWRAAAQRPAGGSRIGLPALFAGSVLGIVAFRNINEVGFRRTILVLLLLSGASLPLA
jgi:hypothetical protein